MRFSLVSTQEMGEASLLCKMNEQLDLEEAREKRMVWMKAGMGGEQPALWRH